jgi:hypothetical protein
MKPDLIVAWPENNDYPVWREMLRANRHRFNKVFIPFTASNSNMDYKTFVVKAMEDDGVTFIMPTPIPKNGDWRHEAVTQAMIVSDTEWVFFTEQDFFFKDNFWDELQKMDWDNLEAIVVNDNGRFHPCGWFMKKEALEKTRKQFGIIPDKLDHFGQIQKDIERYGLIYSVINPKTYHHMNGLSHNFRLITEGGKPVNEPDVFNLYMKRCLEVSVPQSKSFREIVIKYLDGI